MAASAPKPPMATPTPAVASTGASLMPSPTKIVFFTGPRASRAPALSSGSSSARSESSLSCWATGRACSSLSPVSMAICCTPRWRKASMACGDCGLRRSATTKAPKTLPPLATCTTLPGRFASTGVRPRLVSRAALPASSSVVVGVEAASVLVVMLATTPMPGISSMPMRLASSAAMPRFCAARSTDRAMGWFERLSASAAAASSAVSEIPGAGSTAFTSNTPSVRVPVLSRAATRMSRRLSSTAPPLIRMPRREAAPIPPK